MIAGRNLPSLQLLRHLKTDYGVIWIMRRVKGHITRGLLIRSLWIEKILLGNKTWEIRGASTKIRGPIGLIRSGSAQVVGTCELTDVLGPLTLSDMRRNINKHCIPIQDLKCLPYKKTYAWIISNARSLKKPIPYTHPLGAVIWVKLSSAKSA